MFRKGKIMNNGKMMFNCTILLWMLSSVFAFVTSTTAQVYRWDTGEKISDTVPEPGADFSFENLDYADLQSMDLHQSSFFVTSLINAKFNDSIIYGAEFLLYPFVGGQSITASQLYSTASYKQKDLNNIRLLCLDLTGWDLSNQDLTNAVFCRIGFNFCTAIFTDTDFTGAIIKGAFLHSATETGFTAAQLYSTLSYQQKDLSQIDFSFSDLSGWNFQGQDLTDSNFGGSVMTNVNLSESIIKGTNFYGTTEKGFTASQLYSTASYQQKDLSNMDLSFNNFNGWNFQGQNMAGSSFRRSVLANANLSGTIIKGACLCYTTEKGFTASQLYSTASYQQGDIRKIDFSINDLSGWDFSGTRLNQAEFGNNNFTNANLSRADTRGAKLDEAWINTAGNTQNLIRPDGRILGLDIGSGENMLIWDYNGGIVISVEDALYIAPDGSLQINFEDSNWGSTISFETGINVTLDGTLELHIDADIDPNGLIGTTFHIFDWTGVDPTGAFTSILTQPGLIWDTSDLYNSGHVTLLSLGNVLYVNDDAMPGGGGTSWADAYKYLQDALAAASSSDEIRVAQGNYKPDQGGGETPGNREATFQLKNGVTLMGGYAGPGSADPYEREVELYETILSGDLSSNDVEVTDPQKLPDEPNRAENSIHVVNGSSTDETAVIDGFTISGGNANGATVTTDPKQEPLVQGGGMYTESGSPTVGNCIFINNSADWYGGGMINIIGSNPKITQCKFIANEVDNLTLPVYGGSSGAGMVNVFDSNPEVKECYFVGNWGNGMSNWAANPKIRQCQFIENSGSGVLNWDNSDSLVVSCIFRGNEANDGAGIWNGRSDPVIRNCIFEGNEVNTNGGAIWNADSSEPQIINCTFINNEADISGGSIWNGTRFTSDGGNPTIVNCILWNNSPQEIMDDVGVSTVSYSDIEGGWSGVGNIIEAPCFVDPTNSDYHLKSQAGHWDADNLAWLQDNATSLCIDAGDPASDYCGELWPHGGRINMGAYGGTAEASMSLDDSKGCIADLNCDGRVDITDFNMLSGKWMLEQYLLKEDMDRNGRVSLPDAAILCQYWLWEE